MMYNLFTLFIRYTCIIYTRVKCVLQAEPQLSMVSLYQSSVFKLYRIIALNFQPLTG